MFAVVAVAKSNVQGPGSVETSHIHRSLTRWHHCEESESL